MDRRRDRHRFITSADQQVHSLRWRPTLVFGSGGPIESVGCSTLEESAHKLVRMRNLQSATA